MQRDLEGKFIFAGRYLRKIIFFLRGGCCGWAWGVILPCGARGGGGVWIVCLLPSGVILVSLCGRGGHFEGVFGGMSLCSFPAIG